MQNFESALQTEEEDRQEARALRDKIRGNLDPKLFPITIDKQDARFIGKENYLVDIYRNNENMLKESDFFKHQRRVHTFLASPPTEATLKQMFKGAEKTQTIITIKAREKIKVLTFKKGDKEEVLVLPEKVISDSYYTLENDKTLEKIMDIEATLKAEDVIRKGDIVVKSCSQGMSRSTTALAFFLTLSQQNATAEDFYKNLEIVLKERGEFYDLKYLDDEAPFNSIAQNIMTARLHKDLESVKGKEKTSYKAQYERNTELLNNLLSEYNRSLKENHQTGFTKNEFDEGDLGINVEELLNDVDNKNIHEITDKHFIGKGYYFNDLKLFEKQDRVHVINFQKPTIQELKKLTGVEPSEIKELKIDDKNTIKVYTFKKNGNKETFIIPTFPVKDAYQDKTSVENLLKMARVLEEKKLITKESDVISSCQEGRSRSTFFLAAIQTALHKNANTDDFYKNLAEIGKERGVNFDLTTQKIADHGENGNNIAIPSIAHHFFTNHFYRKEESYKANHKKDLQLLEEFLDIEISEVKVLNNSGKIRTINSNQKTNLDNVAEVENPSCFASCFSPVANLVESLFGKDKARGREK